MVFGRRSHPEKLEGLRVLLRNLAETSKCSWDLKHIHRPLFITLSLHICARSTSHVSFVVFVTRCISVSAIFSPIVLFFFLYFYTFFLFPLIPSCSVKVSFFLLFCQKAGCKCQYLLNMSGYAKAKPQVLAAVYHNVILLENLTKKRSSFV